MIQRIQTLFLLGVVILMAIMLMSPIWKKYDNNIKPTSQVELKAYHLTHTDLVTNTVLANKSTWYIAAVIILSAIVALYSIFQYKNRMLQLKLGLLNTLLISGILGTVFLGLKQADTMLPKGTEEFSLGFYVPAIALLLNLMANRFIRKDEQLVKSADRIR
jgi:hypothetical protein